MQQKFSILIPTWNNLDYLKLCVESIRKNSTFEHQIIIHVNDGSDGTLDWVRSQEGLDYRHSEENIGISWALNGLRPLVSTEYILYLNDDMYVLPKWDAELWNEIEHIGHNNFFLSSSMIQPTSARNGCFIDTSDYGRSPADFREKDLLEEYMTIPHEDWAGSTLPPNIVHRDLWDAVGGYSVEFSPGMYSDPEFSAKLYFYGVRLFKGLSASLVYHFEARSTSRTFRKNDGNIQFLNKWGITSRTFFNIILMKGQPLSSNPQIDRKKLKKYIFRSRIKRILNSFKSNGLARELYDL